MKSYRIVLTCLSMALIVSCGGNAEQARLYKAAFEKQKQVIAQIETVEEMMTGLSAQKQDSLSEVLHEVEESLFAIPGYTLELPGHEGHNHDHNRVELTAEEILAVQEELLRQLNDIKTNLTNDK